MKKFHITITNNDTGEAIHDHDTNAIIGAVALDETVRGITLANCTAVEMANTISAAQKTIERAINGHTSLFLALDHSKEQA